MERVRKLVVAGLIVDGDRVLITQRRADQSLPLKWEFPGGKVEPGESPTDALRRELAEEIGARVRVGRIWEVLFHRYDSFDLVMLVYRCELLEGEVASCVEVADMAWCGPTELSKWDILEADSSLVGRLQTEGIPQTHPIH